ncbi:MAG: benzoate-CoA ligase family protein, partial [Chloroflexota bacterium]|nr:benzoate-CoA ligase family protein [Chloroflexota bacterium]
ADLPSIYNAIEILEHNLAVRADKIALYCKERCLTFREVENEANQVGNALKRLGVRFGDCVGILAPDSAEWVTSFFGTTKIGAIAMGLNTLLQTQDYDFILRDSRARVLIVHESLVAVIEPLLNRHPTLQQVIVIGQTQRSEEISFHAWLASEPTTLVAEPTHRDDFCSLHYTSGTTGQPKGMFHAHKDYPLIAQNTGVDLFGLTENDRTFSAAKLFFVYGIGGNLVMPWYVGASTVLDAGSARNAVATIKTIDRFKPTVFYSVPTAYINLLTLPNISARYDLTSLRLCISAGEALPAAVWQAWKQETGLEILDTVGCTETYHTFLSNRPGDLRPGSSGKPSPGYAAKVVDENGVETRVGEIGNLLVKGESLSLFYLHQSERSRYSFRGEWLFTGDKYYVDADGFYWHAGRSDDMFKVGGLWVSPTEVESVLTSHPAVLECAVVGEREQTELVKPKAFIRLKEGFTPSIDLVRQLLQHCGERLAAYKCPRWIDFVDELPRTANGKIQRFKLRTALLNSD